MKPPYFPIRSLEDFVAATPLSIDGTFDDGWGAPVSLKGVEIDAAILFADIRRFTERSADLDPAETLAFVNRFFTWMTAETLRTGHGVVDKYIGDEIMAVYSTAFGSADPLVDALRDARAMAEHDALDYAPRFGIASGRVSVGFVGTAVRFNCSVFGRPVVLAKRCAQIQSSKFGGYSIHFPAEQWGGRNLDDVFPKEKYRDIDGNDVEREMMWELLAPRTVETNRDQQIEVRELHYPMMRAPSFDITEQARTVTQLVRSRKK
jgi:hypothetical protein